MGDILPVSNMIQQPNLLASFQQGTQFGQQQRDRRNNQQAAQLYAQAMQAPPDQRPALLAQIAQLTGVEGATNAQTGLGRQDTAAHDDLVQTAGQFAAIAEADPATAQQMYPSLVAKAHAIGIPVPATYDPKMLPAIQKLAGAMGGAGAVQSTYVDAQGQRVAIMRDGSVRPLGQNAPNVAVRDQPGVPFDLINKSNGQSIYDHATQQGAVPYTIDPSLPPNVQAAIRANPDAGSQQGITTSLLQMPTQRPPARPAMSPAEQARLVLAQNADSRDAERLRLAQEAAARAATPKPTDSAKTEKLAAARADALDSVNQAISGIDSLTHSGGFENLGTFTGDLLGHIPHTQTRDAQNALETVKNQVLLTTLGKLKALSATGASGFGALSNQEGKILKNSIANIDTAQTHDAIVHNLRVIQQTLQRAAGLIGQVHAPAAAPAAGGWSIQEVR
jgi:hypothetical protein